jgi:phosphoribosylformylglycinamidine synthase
LDNLDEILSSHSLSNEDYLHIKKILNREPNIIEIGIFSAMWSEHCSYKSSKIYLNGFPVSAPWVVQGPGENAGVIDVGDDMVAIFKMESHNHPSFIEPYEGAATGVGGILRDIFTMGARPVANMNSIRFGDIARKDSVGKKHRYLLKGAVQGIGDYGNCMGIATVGGETTFEDCFDGNVLVNAFALGVAKKDEVFYARAEGLSNPVIYVGSKTGRDGLGGAVMSSNSFLDDSEVKRPTVQVGDPFTQKLLLEACLELFKLDLIVGIQDMGAAGLTSSAFEMASNSSAGMVMHLDRVPAREEGMTPYEFMLSESQERMLICAKKGCEDRVVEIFTDWGLDASVIGEVTDTGNIELFWHNEKVAEVPVKPVSNEAPMLNRPIKKPKYLDDIQNISVDDNNIDSISDIYLKIMSHIEILDKSFIYEQYDSTVQSNTITKAGDGDASLIRLENSSIGIAMSCDCNSRQCYIDPKLGAAAAVMESGRNVASMGARPLSITDCLNFGNPENPEVMWQFKEACEGIKEACKALNTPVVSGNVSLYNETNKQSIYPTPSIAMVGKIDDYTNYLKSYFSKEGNSLYLLGDTNSEFGASLLLKITNNVIGGVMPKVDFKKELMLWDFLIEANQKLILKSAKDCSSGGLAVALSKMALKSNIGVEIETGFKNELDIFSESLSRAVVEVEDDEVFIEFARKSSISFTKIGITGGENIKIDSISFGLDKISTIYFNEFEKIVNQ